MSKKKSDIIAKRWNTAYQLTKKQYSRARNSFIKGFNSYIQKDEADRYTEKKVEEWFAKTKKGRIKTMLKRIEKYKRKARFEFLPF